MAKTVLRIYLSYSQLCIFLRSLAEPFNSWSDRSFSQGFSWRPGSVSFRALAEEGDHKISLFINETIPELAANVVRAFKVPFETSDGDIEISSISDSTAIEIPAGQYSLQVEFLRLEAGEVPEINVRLNKGDSGFAILRADEEVVTDGDFDLNAEPAT